ncbi:manganese efflux pump [Cobetia sp. cqz5-12]|uniref:manganese efflux pump MntP n=1 Tax=Cobetia sp. cqz5-12 TaxID=2609415 RepID=UPI001908B976|nr:manganese efflux pump MntP family protein [Cobetia sp. cqz5-12]QQK64061.1 manganese efflux pump [Cobetia sp. cqz5-12]
MPLLPTFLLAFSMSCDAFAAALCKGAAIRRPSLKDALRIGLIFGVIEAITPMIGWLIGRSLAVYVEQWDHWIAFALLLLLGLHMIHEGLSKDEEDEECTTPQSLPRLMLTGLSTSIDAMAVGAGLAFAGVNIVTTALAIGTATFVMATTGVMLGGVLGKMVGKRAEIIGGLVLIGIGTTILLDHTGYLG